jgi:hypothetical protein
VILTDLQIIGLRILGAILGTAFLAVVIVFLWLRRTLRLENPSTQERIQWWLDHAYPIDAHLLPVSYHYYFATYEEFRQAGRDIPGIEPILIDMYNHAESKFDKVNSLHALAAVGTPETIAFIRTVAMSSDGAELLAKANLDAELTAIS